MIDRTALQISFAAVLLATSPAVARADDVLPGTAELKLKRPLDEVMVEGIHRFCLRELAQSRGRRGARWRRDFSSVDAYRLSIDGNRDRLKAIIGAVDRRVTVGTKRKQFELLATLEQSSVVARSKLVTVHAVRWPVLDGVTAEGLLLKPNEIRAAVVALPDADWTPEQLCGVEDSTSETPKMLRRLAEAGCLVAIPTLTSRSDEFSGHPDVAFTNMPHREFISRQAFEMGRHVIGFEVQKVLAAVDLFEQMSSPSLPIGVAGVGEGGLIALHAAALDSRIDSTLASGYFREREGVWKEPIYRNVWRLLTEFGDAELAGLIAPRRLVVEACRVDEVAHPPATRPGRRSAAAPGRIEICPLESVQAEFARAGAIYKRLDREQELLLVASGIDGRGPAGRPQAVDAFAGKLGIELNRDVKLADWVRVRTLSHKAREKRQLDEMQEFVQDTLRRSHRVRDKRWSADISSVENWLPARDRLRKMVHEQLIGRLQIPRAPANPLTRLVLDTDDYRGYEVVLDVAPDLIAAGILLLPSGLRRGEKRPVVVCQHGLEGVAMDTISREPQAFQSYKAFAAELCRRGFIVYAPQNPYRGGDRFRSIQRKANPLGLSLFSFIVEQH
ncbi:MAG: hypothetical protein QGG36_13685, partial [Pirellulaceae bacterium]|nr:hypothetical protein [Pirellulaceae bacterium]